MRQCLPVRACGSGGACRLRTEAQDRLGVVDSDRVMQNVGQVDPVAAHEGRQRPRVQEELNTARQRIQDRMAGELVPKRGGGASYS